MKNCLQGWTRKRNPPLAGVAPGPPHLFESKKMTNDLKEYLEEVAARKLTEHEDLFGESPDDAYQCGIKDGETLFAEWLLEAYGK